MKLKKVGAVLAGAALLGATFAAAAAAEVVVPERDFFIDTTTGLNNCLIVVGSSAAAADVVSAAYIAAQIGSMAYYEDITENWDMPGVTYAPSTVPDFEEQVWNYLAGGNGDKLFDDFRDANYLDPESWVVLPYACPDADMVDLSDWCIDWQAAPWWDYDVYVDAFTEMDDDNFLVDTKCSFETISVDFSLRDVECTADLCIACSAACNQWGMFDEEFVTSPDLFECQTYPNVYPRHYWGTPEVYATAYWDDNPSVCYCDPLGGIQYRTIVDEWFDWEDVIMWSAIVGPESEAYDVCDPNAPQCVALYCNACDVYFLGKHYDALSFGTDAAGYDYMFYGTPAWYVEEKLAVGESAVYGDWTLTINDLNIYENKIYLTITDPDGESYTYISVIDSYTSNVPANGYYDPCDYDADYDSQENDAIAFVGDEFDVYSLCGDELLGSVDLGECCDEVLFAVNFIKTFIGAAGNYVVEYHAYNLEEYGVLREQVYAGPCETPIAPAIKVGDLEWYFDIIPNNGLLLDDDDEIIDLDNLPALYAEGNPNFDVADQLTIYKPIAAADVPADPEDQEKYFPYYANDGTVLTITDGFTVPICVPMLELWLATPVELAGLCDDELTISLEDCDGANYFTLVVNDVDHTDYRIDTSIEIYKKVPLEPTVTKIYKEIDPESLVKLDETIDATMKNTYNLVLVGGPVANILVQELVDLGKTTFEQWENAIEGDTEVIEDAYAVGKDVLIVAGADRDATAAAALALIAAL